MSPTTSPPSRATRRETADILSPRYRDQAVRAYVAGQLLDATGPRTWTLFSVLVSAVVALAVLALAFEVEVVGAGRGRVRGEALELVTVIAEADRAFIDVGQEVTVDLDQLPASEFGTLRARVVGLSDDLVTADEVKTVLGEGGAARGPCYRVNLELVRDERYQRVARYIRPGMLATTRHALRRRRVITFVLDPAGRWSGG